MANLIKLIDCLPANVRATVVLLLIVLSSFTTAWSIKDSGVETRLTILENNQFAIVCLVYIIADDGRPSACEAFMDDNMKKFVQALLR